MRPRLRVGFILASHFTLTAFASFVDVLRLSADEGDRSRQIACQWNVLASRQKPIVSSCGISVFSDMPLADPTSYDYLVVVGGLLDSGNRLDEESERFLRLAASKGVPLVGLCTGSFYLQFTLLVKG